MLLGSSNIDIVGIAPMRGPYQTCVPATASEFSDGFVAAMGVAAGLSLLAALAGAALPGRLEAGPAAQAAPIPPAEPATEGGR